MTQAQALATIRTLPDMMARCDDGEYRITFATHAIRAANIKAGVATGFAFVNARAEAVACYTGDAADAVDTARAMQTRGYQA